MRVILARHGNTFSPGDKVVWVGAENDLPLSSSGVLQAQHLATVLKDIPLSAIYTGDLARLRSTGEIVQSSQPSHPALHIDTRLNEIDYGLWSGKSNEEIVSLYGSESLDMWGKRGIWPSDAGWKSDESSVVQECHAFFRSLVGSHSSDSTVLVVSSNGRLRYFLRLIPGAFEVKRDSGELKISTGHISTLIWEAVRSV